MSEPVTSFVEQLRARFPEAAVSIDAPRGEVGIVFDATAWHDGCRSLRDEFGFAQLIDLCGIDYLGHGSDEWDTDVSSEGFSRGVEGRGPGRFRYGERPSEQTAQPQGEVLIAAPQRRFAVVAQLLSVQHNRRIRVRCFAPDDNLPIVASVRDLETGTPALGPGTFDIVVVFCYLHRPLFPELVASVRAGGLLIYETFTRAQAARGKP